MLRRILTTLLAVLLGVIIVTLAVINRHPVQLILDPFHPEAPALSLMLPFYGYLLGTLVLGVIMGGMATWLSQGRWRKTARAQGQRAARYEAEAERLVRERESHVTNAKQLALGAG